MLLLVERARKVVVESFLRVNVVATADVKKLACSFPINQWVGWSLYRPRE